MRLAVEDKVRPQRAMEPAPDLVAVKLTGLAPSFIVRRGRWRSPAPRALAKQSDVGVLAGLQMGFTGHDHVTRTLTYVVEKPTLLPGRSALANITLATGCAQARAEGRLADAALGARGAVPGPDVGR